MFFQNSWAKMVGDELYKTEMESFQWCQAKMDGSTQTWHCGGRFHPCAGRHLVVPLDHFLPKAQQELILRRRCRCRWPSFWSSCCSSKGESGVAQTCRQIYAGSCYRSFSNPQWEPSLSLKCAQDPLAQHFLFERSMQASRCSREFHGSRPAYWDEGKANPEERCRQVAVSCGRRQSSTRSSADPFRRRTGAGCLLLRREYLAEVLRPWSTFQVKIYWKRCNL